MRLPEAVKTVCDEINALGRALIVGGFLRDRLLGLESFDIDIEVYEVPNLEDLQKVLAPLGSLHEVGKSFGVILLQYEAYSFDITLARRENKVGIGHRGFKVTPDPYAPFETIALRRDFTINAMGYDTKDATLLDPFGGQDDLEHKRLDLIDAARFAEDPLRVLRAVGFISRFSLSPTQRLIDTAASMVGQGLMRELSGERVYAEVQKWFEKGEDISAGFAFLQSVGYRLFPSVTAIKRVLPSLDRSAKAMQIRLTLLYRFTPIQEALADIAHFCSSKQLLKKVEQLHTAFLCYESGDKSDYALKKVSVILPVREWLPLVEATDSFAAARLAERAKQIGIYDAAPKPLVKGQDLIASGMKPSKNFSVILQEIYDLQLQDAGLTKQMLLDQAIKSR